MTGNHAAAGPAAGYLYQCERALLEAIEASNSGELTLFLEGLDDVVLERVGSPREMLQLKHHIGGGPELSDTSVDLWRSIGVWIDVTAVLGPLDSPVVYLLTTAKVASGSVGEALSADPPEAEKALAALEASAGTSTNAETARHRRAFMALDSGARKRLVEAIRIRPEQAEITDIDAELSSALTLRMWIAPSHEAAFLETLKGWWYGRCVEMLTAKIGITSTDISLFIQDLKGRFGPDNLPPSYDLLDPDEAELDGYRQSVFVQQLLWIAYTNDQLLQAIRDYHRAFSQRSKWQRQGLLFPGELDDYESRLVEQWKRTFYDMVANLDQNADDAAKETAGRQLVSSLRDGTSVTIRPEYRDVMLTSGTLHGLSDQQRIGWHVEFQARLEILLKGSV